QGGQPFGQLARRGNEHRRRGTRLAVLRGEVPSPAVPHEPGAALSRFVAELRERFPLRLVSIRLPAGYGLHYSRQRRPERLRVARRSLALCPLARRPDG